MAVQMDLAGIGHAVAVAIITGIEPGRKTGGHQDIVHVGVGRGENVITAVAVPQQPEVPGAHPYKGHLFPQYLSIKHHGRLFSIKIEMKRHAHPVGARDGRHGIAMHIRGTDGPPIPRRRHHGTTVHIEIEPHKSIAGTSAVSAGNTTALAPS